MSQRSFGHPKRDAIDEIACGTSVDVAMLKVEIATSGSDFMTVAVHWAR